MEASSSSLGIKISLNPSIRNALPRPRGSGLPFVNKCSSFSWPRQNFSRAHLAVEPKLLKTGIGRRGFECRNSVCLDGSTESEGGQHSEGLIRRKRLAVFVSGGGSNFRSIHEATLCGSVYGDVVVLVTDKPG